MDKYTVLSNYKLSSDIDITVFIWFCVYIILTANTLNLWLKLYMHHLYLVFSIFCIHKTILYNLIFVFRIEQIDKCLGIFISYEIKSNIILVIFREWLILSHLYLLVFAILIIFHIFWLFITSTHTIDWL